MHDLDSLLNLIFNVPAYFFRRAGETFDPPEPETDGGHQLLSCDEQVNYSRLYPQADVALA